MRDPAHPQRILQLTATSDLGGAERMVLHLVSGLDRERFTPYVCSTVGSGELIELARPFCAAVEHLRFSSPLDPSAALRMGRFIRRHEIDLVQIHGLRAEAVGRPVARGPSSAPFTPSTLGDVAFTQLSIAPRFHGSPSTWRCAMPPWMPRASGARCARADSK